METATHTPDLSDRLRAVTWGLAIEAADTIDCLRDELYAAQLEFAKLNAQVAELRAQLSDLSRARGTLVPLDLTAGIEQSAVSRTYELADENERLRAQVAELLPFAEREARRRSMLHPHANSAHRESGERLLARIDAGEFREAAP